MSDDNWSWQVSKMTFFKRLDLVNGKREGIGSLPGLCWFLASAKINMDWQRIQRNRGRDYRSTLGD